MTDPYRLVVHPPEALVAFGEAGDRTAVQLLRDVAAVRHALPKAEPGSELLVICQDRYLFAIGLLAAWQAGHGVALPPNGAPETVRTLSRRPGVLRLLHDLDGGEGLDLRVLLATGQEAEPEPMEPIAPGRPIATLYTSGSTGEHQPCPKIASQLLGEALSHVGTFELGPGTRFLATLPPHHIYGLLYSVLAPLLGGGAFLRETPFHAETVALALEHHRIDVLVSVPAHLRGLEVLSSLPKVQRTFSSGAPLPDATARDLLQRFGLVVTEVYGSSETGGVAWRDPPDSAWTNFPGVTASTSADRQLLIDSPFLSPGIARPFACSDRAATLPDGGFRLLGRLDGVVKVGGKRVALAELEKRCLALEGVSDAAATAVESDGARGQEIWLVVASETLTPERLRAALIPWFDPSVLPRRTKIVARLPREENGKITRRRLRALFEDPNRGGPSVTHLEPTGETRRTEGEVEITEIEVPISPDLVYFRGHFDGMAILPGVVQLEELVLRNLQRRWPDLKSLRKIRKLQFKRITQPRQVVVVRLSRPRGEARVDFEILREGQPNASGTLCFE